MPRGTFNFKNEAAAKSFRHQAWNMIGSGQGHAQVQSTPDGRWIAVVNVTERDLYSKLESLKNEVNSDN